MFETMYHAPGIGLAAPQVNVSKRLFVVHLQDDDDKHGPFVVVNPKFTLVEGEIESIEGCLVGAGHDRRSDAARARGLQRPRP